MNKALLPLHYHFIAGVIPVEKLVHSPNRFSCEFLIRGDQFGYGALGFDFDLRQIAAVTVGSDFAGDAVSLEHSGIIVSEDK